MTGPRSLPPRRSHNTLARLLTVAVFSVIGVASVVLMLSTARQQPPPWAVPPGSTGAAAASRTASAPDRLFAFTMPTLDGGTISAAQLKGQPAVIKVFASWCPRCWVSLPHTEAVYNEYAQRGLRVIGVGVLSAEDDLRSMVHRLRITYPVAYDLNGLVSVQTFGLRNVPTTLFVDRQGVVRVRWEGTMDRETLRRLIAQIL